MNRRPVAQRLVERSRELRRFPRARHWLEHLLGVIAGAVPKSLSNVVVHGLDESEDGALALVVALRERGFTPVRLTNGARSSPFRIAGVRYRSKYTLLGFWSFARAGVVFTSQALYGGLGGGSQQQTVLLWHGEVVKPVGLLDNGRALVADVAPVCSALAQAFRVAEFGLRPRQVPIVGSPRNDRMLAARCSDIRSRLNWPPDRPTWLWLPTYRTAVRGERRSDGREVWHGLPYAEDDLAELDRRLAADGLHVILKPHPLAQQQLPRLQHGHLRLVSQGDLERLGVSLYELMAAVDGMITDASSVWVDFLLEDKPLIFAFPDLDEYRADRGLNLEPYEDWAPGPVVSGLDEVVAQMTAITAGVDDYAERRRSALRRFHRFRDAGSTARLLDRLELFDQESAASEPAASSRATGAGRPRARRRRTNR